MPLASTYGEEHLANQAQKTKVPLKFLLLQTVREVVSDRYGCNHVHR